MPRRNRRTFIEKTDEATKCFFEGHAIVSEHPLFSPLCRRTHVVRNERSICPSEGWAVVRADGAIHVHPTRRCAKEEWVYVLCHCLLHLGFEHFQEKENARAWNAACDCFVAKFLRDLKLGRPPQGIMGQFDFPSRDEEHLYRYFYDYGIAPEFAGFGTAGLNRADIVLGPSAPIWRWHAQQLSWPDCLKAGITQAVRRAVEVAAGDTDRVDSHRQTNTSAHMARRWLISNYPLLGALAESFDIIEDPLLCQRLGISIAAVSIEGKEIYFNPAAAMSPEEARFVMAHELLHVGLRHDVRQQGRDPYFWNIACDYVINQWLLDMEVGVPPRVGLLVDSELKGLSAESVYDRIVTDLRRYRKLATFAGLERCDMLKPRAPDWWRVGAGLTLDEFYRNCLSRGLFYHEQEGRGYLPLGLIEEIRALDQPPIPWDVELAQWLDSFFAPLEKRRSFARPSRRQSSTPDIARPSWRAPADESAARTFGVVLDTSGSMDRLLLAKALGAVASYAMSRDVPMVRLIFCDASAYDQGYVAPESIAGRVKVRGRGGTVLQPGIRILETADDFPKSGPILIITDGYCDHIKVRNEHAYLLPQGRHLPFAPMGRVFRFK